MAQAMSGCGGYLTAWGGAGMKTLLDFVRTKV